MGVVCSELGEFDEAESFYKRALADREKIGKAEDSGSLEVMEHYAALLRKVKGRDTEAAQIEARMKKIRAATAPETTKP